MRHAEAQPTMPMLPILSGVPPACLRPLMAAGEAAGAFERSRDPAHLARAALAWHEVLSTPGFADAPRATQAAYARMAIDVVEAVHHFTHEVAWLETLATLESSAAPLEDRGSNPQLGWLNRASRHALEAFQETGEVTWIDRAIAGYQQAVSVSAIGSLTWRILSSNLASALRDRYEATDDPAPLDDALAHARASIDGAAIDPQYAPPLWLNLAMVLLCRFRLSRARDDQQACADAILRMRGAAIAVGAREFIARADEADRLLERSVQAAPDALERWHTGATTALREYDTTGEVRALNRAIGALRRAVAFSTAGTRGGDAARHDLAVALGRRYERQNAAADLDEAIALASPLVDSDADPEGRALHLNGLATLLYHRHERVGDPADLDRCIEVLRAAGHALPSDSPHRAALVGNLGNALRVRYLAVGRIDDLAESVEACRIAFGMLPPGAPTRGSRASNLTLALLAQYRRSDRLDDLDDAIEAGRAAYAETPAKHPYHHGAANNLGLALRYRHGRTHVVADRDEAIALFEEAARAAEPGVNDRGYYLDNLASCLADRALDPATDPGEAIHDAARAVEASEQAIVLMPGGDNGATFQANLAWHLLVAFRHAPDRSLLDRAVQAAETSVALSPPHHPYLAERQARLSDALSLRATVSNDARDLDAAIAADRAAIEALETNLRSAPLALSLGEQSAWSTLYERATRHLCLRDRDAEALLTAERRKSWFLVSLLSRGDVPVPPGLPTDVIGREQTLRAQLAQLDIEALASAGGAVGAEREVLAEASARSRTVDELTRTWADLEQQGPDAAAYVALRRGGSLSSSDLGAAAGMLPPGGVFVSVDVAEHDTLVFAVGRGKRARTVARRIDGLGRDAWADIVRRVTREVAQSRGSARVRETWQAPLAAFSSAVRELVDRARLIVFSPDTAITDVPWSLLAERDHWAPALCIVPGLGVLAHVLGRRAGAEGDALVVGNPTGDLPFARLEADLVGQALSTTPLYGEAATKAAVLERFSRARLAHLAAHAFFDRADPFASGIRLADGVLTARELLEGRHRVPPFLVLSACQTGLSTTLGERTGQGELAGLTHALLHAGARSLVVSLWEVADASAASMMVHFHRASAKAASGTRRAAALHMAMRTVRDAEARWAHPYHWGSFALVGDWRD